MADDPTTPDPNAPDPNAPAGKTFSEDYVKTVRSEAAGYRTQLRATETRAETAERERDEARTALAAATSSTADADGRITVAEATALKYRVALEKGVPATLADRLQGSTREEIEADATALLQLATGASTTFSAQGRTDGPPPTTDVGAALRRLAQGN